MGPEGQTITAKDFDRLLAEMFGGLREVQQNEQPERKPEIPKREVRGSRYTPPKNARRKNQRSR